MRLTTRHRCKAAAAALAAAIGMFAAGAPAVEAQEGPDAPQASLDTASATFDEVITFDGYDAGELAGQDGWATSAAAVSVTDDPVVNGNQVMGISGPGLRAHRAASAIPEGGTGTIFFRFYRGGSVDTSVGLSDVDAPSTFSHFEVQANNQNSTTLNARDGGGFSPAGTWTQGVWQCVWMVADNAGDSYQMYSRGGPYEATTRLPVDQETAFAFRNGTTEALDRFFVINGATSPGDLYIDDLAVDADAANLQVPSGDTDSCVPGGDEPLVDPLPDPVTSGLALTVEEFATFPETEPVPPPTDPRLMRRARINYLGEVPDGSGRLYVPDLNGPLYLVEDGELHEYLDVGETFAPDFFSGAGIGSGFGFATFHPDFAENGKLYTVHTERGEALSKPTDLPPQPNTNFHGVITEWTADDPSANTFSGTRRQLLRLGFTTRIHGIQQIDFNPTAEPGDEDYGLLYIGAGDGGRGVSSDDPQDLSLPHGKVLRIDPLGTDGANGRYGIPPSNPFVDQPGALGEIYAYGLRNPHRFSWDAAEPHRMFLGNIGQHRIESVYEVRAGDNFGWSEREGPFVFRNDDPDCNVFPLPRDDGRFGFTYPVAAYDHNVSPEAPCRDVGVAVIGGFVYRGSDVPELRGKYVFGDDVDGSLYFTEATDMRRNADKLATIRELMVYDETGQRVTMQDLAGDDRVDLRFGQDTDGELYILSKANGTIWKVTGTRQFASCDVGSTTVTDVMGAENWDPVSPDKWEFPGDEVILTEPGENPGPPRRPFEYAVLTAGPEFGSVEIKGEVRIDTPVEITNRDVIIVFGYRSPTEFYYVHLSTDNTIFPHNGIFVVNNADRDRIEDQWDPARSLGAEPAITDLDWHSARVVHCADSGEIAVYIDGSHEPLMTTVDTTFDSGRVGFGSFDNIGRLRELTVTGTPAGN